MRLPPINNDTKNAKVIFFIFPKIERAEIHRKISGRSRTFPFPDLGTYRQPLVNQQFMILSFSSKSAAILRFAVPKVVRCCGITGNRMARSLRMIDSPSSIAQRMQLGYVVPMTISAVDRIAEIQRKAEVEIQALRQQAVSEVVKRLSEMKAEIRILEGQYAN